MSARANKPRFREKELELDRFLTEVGRRNPGEPEFLQAVQEVAGDVIAYTADKPQYLEYRVLERMVEPDRIISFRVCWQDDKGNTHINRGYRVQCNNAIGPEQNQVVEIEIVTCVDTEAQLTGVPRSIEVLRQRRSALTMI